MVAKVSGPLIRSRWWREPEEKLHEAIYSAYNWLYNNESIRRSKLLRASRLYENEPIQGLSVDEYDSTESGINDRVSLNVTRSVVDSVHARLSKNRPKPTFLTERGNFSLQQQAKRLDAWTWGVFYLTDTHRKMQMMFRDAEIWGTGILRVTEKVDGKVGHIGLERVYPWEILVDPIESMYGEPRSVIQCRLIDRAVLAEMFPDHEKILMDEAKTPRAAMIGGTGRDTLADQIVVLEAWHLPSSSSAEDGVRAVAVENATLVREDWKSARFPFSFLHWSHPQIGFWGRSLVDEVEGIQLEVNELSDKVQAAMYHNAIPWILIENGSKIERSSINNDIRGVEIEYSGTQPKVEVHATIHPEVFAERERLIQRAYQIPGVSELSATGMKPAGLDSGKALRTYEDIQSIRFMPRGQDYERVALTLAQLDIDAARRLDEYGADVEVVAESRTRHRSFVQRIKWSDVRMEENAFELKIFPASSLPQDPAGRIAAVESLIQAGMLDKTEAMSLLDFPDIDPVMSRELAAYDVILDIVERMLEDGEYVAPEPFMDLALGIKIVNSSYLRATLDRAPQDRLELMREWMDSATKLAEIPQQAAAAAAAEAPAAPPPMGANGAPPMMPPGAA